MSKTIIDISAQSPDEAIFYEALPYQQGQTYYDDVSKDFDQDAEQALVVTLIVALTALLALILIVSVGLALLG